VQIRHRRALPQDIARGREILEPERILFSQRTWQQMPELLEDLLARERILLCPLDDVETGRMVGMGGSGFLHPDFLEAALAAPGGLIDAAFTAESEGRPAFLNRRQIAEANRAADLRLMNFFGTPPGVDVNHPGILEVAGSFTEVWNFYHRGFALREIWMEHAIPLLIELTSRIGLRVYRERMLPSGALSRLSVITREEAMKSTPSWPGSAMISPRPRFGFTAAEQQLLELALLDHSDRDAAAALRLSTEAIKKRWRSIYHKVSEIEAALLPPECKGSGQRRALLQSLRNNLQELRPY
jgi:hypothetical protein